MRGGSALVLLVACGHAAAPPAAPSPTVPRLQAPRPIDPSARGAAYVTAVALQLQPGWGQFLDDCRLRLPASHALNRLSLATTAELAIERGGRIAEVRVAPSGNADFDRAVRDAIADAAPLPAPPAELVSDDDRAHLRWLFARDRRQAGPATAEVVTVERPLAQIIPAWLARGELARAARRIAHAPLGAERAAAVAQLVDAVFGEAATSREEDVVRALARKTGAPVDADPPRPPPCPAIARGLTSPSATLRAACLDAVRALAAHDRASFAARIRELARDRDDEVRARAIALVVELDPPHAIRATSDASRVVRVAYAAALVAHLDRPELAADATALIEDRAPEVRAAAWDALARAGRADAGAVARALADPSELVRERAAPLSGDAAALAKLAAADDAPAVRTEALIRLAQLRGRAAMEGELLDRIAAAPPASVERVRAALAWLLAR